MVKAKGKDGAALPMHGSRERPPSVAARPAPGALAWPGPERILLVRLGAIGDIVFASPLIDAFRAAWPDARLAWLAQPNCLPLLAHHPLLDAVIEWPQPRLRALLAERRFGGLRRELSRLGRDLRTHRFDLAVDLQGLMKSALPTRLTGAPKRVGLDSREGSALLMTRVIRSPRDHPRIGSEYHALAAALGLPLGDFAMRVEPGSEARARAAEMIHEADLEHGFALLCPFTTRAQKHWLEDRWAETALRLGRSAGDGGLGLSARLLGGPGDGPAAARIARAAGLSLDAWVGRTSLPLAAALIERATLLLGVDTGLSHMGIAAKTPSVLLFGSTRPYLQTGRAAARVLYLARDCSPCRRRPTCDGRFDCMRAIKVDQVLAAARAVIGRVDVCRRSGHLERL